MRLVEYLAKLPSLLRGLLSFDARERSLYEYFRGVPRRTGEARSVLLMQCVEDPYYFALFGQIASSLRERQPIRIEQFVLRSLIVGESKSLWLFLKTRLITSPLFSRKWLRLYSSFCDTLAYRSTSFRPFADAVDFYRAWTRWRTLLDRKSLADLVIDDIPAGDLVNDSYLRFKPAPTVDLNDPYLCILIWQSYRDVRRAKEYFSRNRPALYITSYSTYIQHGIAVRAALQCGVRVISFGNYVEFSKELSVGDQLHTKNSDNYASDFAKLEGSESKLALAEAAVSARMAGVIDNATGYMKKSAYAETGEPVPDVRGAIVVFLHDFYDSPHVYRDVVFPDFWEWVCFTIETLRMAKVRFFLKPHPNQVLLNDDVISALKRRYPAILFVSPNVTNKQLAEAGMACAVTVYGTVAHEVAYLGVPTIACARHPHVSFGFCRTARSRKEYADALRSHKNIDIDKAQMRRQSLIFYYMHNLNIDKDKKLLRDSVSELRLACARPAESDANLVNSLMELSRLPGYEAHLSEWSRVLKSPSPG